MPRFGLFEIGRVAAMTEMDQSVPAVPNADEPVGDLLHIFQESDGAAMVLRAVGEVDMVTSRLLAEHLTRVESEVVPPAPIVLDLTGVTFLDSAGLTVLVDHHQRCVELGTVLRIVADHRAVMRTLELTGLDALLTVVPRAPEARG
jgi:anti-sigma B factor antagonist